MFVTDVPVFVLCAKNILKLFYIDSCLYYLLDINKLEFLWYYYIVVLLRRHGQVGFVYNFFKFHLFVVMWSLTLNNQYNKIDTNWTWLFLWTHTFYYFNSMIILYSHDKVSVLYEVFL